MKRTLVLTVVLVTLLSIGLAVPVSGIVPEPPSPCIELEKTGPATATPGETITYHFTVTNCGEVNLASFTVYELPSWEPLFGGGPLAPGAYAEDEMLFDVPPDKCDDIFNEAKAIGWAEDGQSHWHIDSWTVDVICEPGGEGCTPGYWRNLRKHGAQWVTYSPTDDFEAVFGVDASFSDTYLGSVVRLGGGGENALARHAVAALLNASSPAIAYMYTEAEIIALVQEAYATGDFEAAKDLLEYQNEVFCPL
jgi:hypothetical protein